MNEADFLKEYQTRFTVLLDNSFIKIVNLKGLPKESVYKEYIYEIAHINHKGNELISEIMNEFDLDYNYKIQNGNYFIPLSSYLVLMSSSIQLKGIESFKEKITFVLSETLY